VIALEAPVPDDVRALIGTAGLGRALAHAEA
jgi:hypothetical protein